MAVTNPVPRSQPCPECVGGRVAIDRCEKCGHSGRVYIVKGQIYPDTREGYEAAEKAFGP